MAVQRETPVVKLVCLVMALGFLAVVLVPLRASGCLASHRALAGLGTFEPDPSACRRQQSWWLAHRGAFLVWTSRRARSPIFDVPLFIWILVFWVGVVYFVTESKPFKIDPRKITL